MTKVLIEFMLLDAVAYWLDLLIVAVVSPVAWHWLVKGWKAFVRWVWGTNSKEH